jgi:hypothetical protein
MVVLPFAPQDRLLIVESSLDDNPYNVSCVVERIEGKKLVQA